MTRCVPIRAPRANRGLWDAHRCVLRAPRDAVGVQQNGGHWFRILFDSAGDLSISAVGA